jgi:4-amino-4-deoxy-L-arabinose transferase-like glycosyltransferase
MRVSAADVAADGGSPDPVRLDPALLWILAGALAIRLGVLFVVSPTPLAGDELDYFWRGAERAQAIEPADLGFRPPLMEFLYGALFRVTGPSIPAARVATVLISVLLLIPLHDIARRFGGRGAARLATVLAALYPNFIAFSHYLWSETVYLFLVLWGIALIGSYVERPALWKLGVAGVAIGLSALTRVVGVAFPVLVAGWLVWISRSELRRSLRPLAAPACLLAAVALPIAPWTASLNREGEPFAPITRTTWLYLYIGNARPLGGDPVIHYLSLGETRIEREAKARELVLHEIWERLPAWPLEKIASELPDFFSPKSFAVRRLQLLRELSSGVNWAWSYRFRFHELDTLAFRSRVGVLTVCSYVAIVLLGAMGLALMPASRWRQLVLIFVFSQIAPTIVTFAVSRFRIASMAVAILGAAWLIRTGPDAWRNASPVARVTALAATTAIAWMIALRWDQLSTNAWG